MKGEGKRVAVFHPEFIEDLSYWVETERRTAKRLLDLVAAILRDPFKGIGHPDAEIDYVAGSRLLARCVEATGCEHIGLLLGERSVPSLLGIAGFMLQTAPDVGTALGDLVRHLDLHDRGALVTLSIHS